MFRIRACRSPSWSAWPSESQPPTASQLSRHVGKSPNSEVPRSARAWWQCDDVFAASHWRLRCQGPRSSSSDDRWGAARAVSGTVAARLSRHATNPIKRNCPCRRPFRRGQNGLETPRNTVIGGGGNRTGHFVGPRRRSQLQRLACPKPRNDARRSCLAVCSVCQDAFVSARNLRSNAWRAALWSAVYLPFLGVRRP